MHLLDLTIIIPVYEKKEIIKKLINHYKFYFENYPLFIINLEGGEELKKYSKFYEKTIESFWIARKRIIEKVQTKYVFCLDSDTLVPEGYIEEAIRILSSNPDVAVVAIDYEELQGHLAFGTSIWKTNILKELYNWTQSEKDCECIYIWIKVTKSGYKLETLPVRAKHLK